MPYSRILRRISMFLCTTLPFIAFSQNSATPAMGGIPFSYTINGAAKISAGVFKPDSTLVRTLWSNGNTGAGNFTASWDGRNDSGNLVPDGNYQIKILSNNVQYEWQGVVGNTSDNFTGNTVHSAHQLITSMTQFGNAMYYVVGYTEQSDAHYKFQIATPNQAGTSLPGSGISFRYVATDGSKVYYAGQIPKSGLSFHAITAINASATGQDVLSTFSAGENIMPDLSHFVYSIFDKTQLADENDFHGITGITVQPTGNYLFSAHQYIDTIKVFNKSTGAFVRNLFLAAPREIAIQGDNVLWAITATRTVAKYTINNDGTISSGMFTLPGLTEPIALAVSPDGTKIAVADRGTTAHQVKIFNTSTGALLSTIGRNESYSNPRVFDDKFYFNNTRVFRETNYGAAHCFLQYQSDGTLWVGDYGNMRCQHFAANGTYINNIQYMGYSYSSQVDINNPTRVFSDYLEFKVDYAKALDNGQNGSWKFVRNWSFNANKAYESGFARLIGVSTLSNGRTYATYGLPAQQRQFIELDTVTGIRYINTMINEGTESFDSDGSIWQTGNNSAGSPSFWKRKPLTGFDNSNNLTWGSYTNLETIANVKADDPLTVTGQLNRNQVTSNNIIAGFKSDNRVNSPDGGYHLGGYRNGRWLWRTSKATHVGINFGTNQYPIFPYQYLGEYPTDGAYDLGNYVNNPGSFMQVIERNIFWGYNGEFWKANLGGGQANKYNHYYDNGLMIGQFGVSGDVAKEAGYKSYPGMAGNALTGTYVKIGSDIYFYHCDEGQHAGVHRWKISGLNTIQEQVIPIVKNGTPPNPINDFTDLMAGLPFADTMTNNTAGWTKFGPESATFSVRTNYGTYKKADRDLRIFSLGQNVDCWVKRDLGNNTGLVNWKITGEMSYPEAVEYGDNFMEVLDAADRIIVRISRPITYPNLEIKANASRVAYGDIYTHVGKLRPLSIVANTSTITVNYSNFIPVTVTPFNPQADISNPTTLRFYTVSHPSGHQVNIARLKFYKNIGISPGHFRSKATGLWKNNSSWQSSQDSTNWVDAANIPDSSSKSIVIYNGHTITLTDTVTVDQLTIQNSSGLKIAPNAMLKISDRPGNDVTVAGSATMLIQSDATGTGKIGYSTGNIAGNVTVERFIAANNNLAYRLLAPSVNTVGGPKPYIRSNWQEGQNNGNILANSNNTPNYGIHITGSIIGANGFDATLAATPSLLYYNQTATVPAWMPVANTDATNLDVKKGYLIYVRGDRSTDLHNNSTSSNTTLRTTGTVAIGTQTFTSLEGNGRNSLITNPYPCAVDWSVIYNDPSTANAANFENYYTYWDPNMGVSGGYVTVNANGTKSAGTNATTEIQPGQAFFIRAKHSVVSPTLTIKEIHKSGTSNNNVFRIGAREQFRAALYYSDAGTIRRMADAVNAVFDTAFSSSVDGNDAEEMANWDENVGITRASKMFSIEGRPLIDLTDTLQLIVQRLKIQAYEWQFEPIGFAQANLKAYLEDKYTGQRLQMNLTGNTIIPFSVSSAPASYAPDRFRIVFAPNSSLPITMRSLKAYQKGTGIEVAWVVSNEENTERYEVEKSFDGRNFVKSGTVLPNATGSLTNSYYWFDQQPKEGNNYYRIKTIDKNGTVSYSGIVNVKIGSQKEKFEIYPNPFEGSYITVQFNNVVKGTYTVNFINVAGQKILSKIVNHSGGSASQTMRIDNSLPPGSYTLQIIGEGITFNKKILK